MGRGKVLSDLEKGQIIAYKNLNMSNNQISKNIGRSPTVVDNFVNKSDSYGTKKSPGRPSVLTQATKRRLFRTISNNHLSVNQLKSTCDISASKWTIRRALNNSENFKFMKMSGAPKLTEAHLKRREDWAKEKLSFGDKWRKIIFSDEKKFNLDGPDGYKYYWHDLRKDKLIFSQRGFGGGNIMVWAAIGYNGKSEIAFISNKMDSGDYQNVMQQYLLPVAQTISGPGWIYQQDNAKIHTSNSTMTWLKRKKVRYIDWPACSPDLNIIENLWGILARRVYQNGRQYNNISELKQAIVREWDKIEINEVRILYDSMLQRVAKVATNGGRFL
jgi:transposase